MAAKGAGAPRIAVAAVLVVLAASCSSSKDADEAQDTIAAEALTGGPSDTAPAEAGPGEPGSAAATGSPGSDGGAPAPPGGAPGPSGSGTGAQPGAPGAAAPTATGKGITDAAIKLGVIWADASAYNAAGSSLGGEPGFYEPDDPKGIQKAVIDHVNASGGIRGRTVEPVWHEILVQNAVTKDGRARDAQEACATYTEDNPVFAFMGSGQWTEPNIVECAASTGTPYVDGWGARTGMWLSEERAKGISDFYYHLSGLTTERRERALATSLVRQKFFAKDAKVGILVEESASIKEGVARGLKPALKAAGVNVVDEIVYPDIIEAPWQTYVLRFQSAGVTHVLFSASTGESWPTLLFMRGAENQGYRPAYGISSLPVSWLQTNAPAAQLEKAKGVSWLAAALDEEPPVTSENDRVCREIMAAKGHPADVGAPFCDYFFFIRDALERATALTPAGMADAAEGLGDGWSSILTYKGRTAFGPGRHDGAVFVRDFAWSARDAAMVHTSDVYEAG